METKTETKSNKFKVWRDTQEKKGKGWIFPANDRCLGTDLKNMWTGDYTIEGMEDFFLVERKGSISEYCTNLFQKRFHDELYRMDEVPHPYLILEFQAIDIVNYPKSSTIPPHLWKSIKITPQQFMKVHHETQLDHPNLKVVFVGSAGKQYMMSLFKRMHDLKNGVPYDKR